MIGYKDFNWENNVLYLWNERIAEVIRDKEHPTQFRILWENGDSSQDFYNLNRAKNNCIEYTMYERNVDLRSPENIPELSHGSGR